MGFLSSLFGGGSGGSTQQTQNQNSTQATDLAKTYTPQWMTQPDLSSLMTGQVIPAIRSQVGQGMSPDLMNQYTGQLSSSIGKTAASATKSAADAMSRSGVSPASGAASEAYGDIGRGAISGQVAGLGNIMQANEGLKQQNLQNAVNLGLGTGNVETGTQGTTSTVYTGNQTGSSTLSPWQSSGQAVNTASGVYDLLKKMGVLGTDATTGATAVGSAADLASILGSADAAGALGGDWASALGMTDLLAFMGL